MALGGLYIGCFLCNIYVRTLIKTGSAWAIPRKIAHVFLSSIFDENPEHTTVTGVQRGTDCGCVRMENISVGNLSSTLCPSNGTKRHPGPVIATGIIAILGLIHNVLFLIAAARQKWFSTYQYYLICTQVIVHFLVSLAWLLEVALTISPGSLAFDETSCLILAFSVRLLMNASMKSAIIVGVDRFLVVLAPYFWAKLARRYRYGLIAVSWAWAIANESWPFTFLPGDPSGCFKSDCLGLVQRRIMSHHDVKIFAWIGWSVDTILPVGLYFAILIFAERLIMTLHRRCMNVLCSAALEDQVRKQHTRLYIMTLGTFITNSFISLGLFLVDIGYMPEVTPVALTYVIWPFYIFAWADQSFRGELKRVLLLTK